MDSYTPGISQQNYLISLKFDGHLIDSNSFALSYIPLVEKKHYCNIDVFFVF